MPLSAADYRPRDAEHAVLYRVIAEHVDAFLLDTAKCQADGPPCRSSWSKSSETS